MPALTELRRAPSAPANGRGAAWRPFTDWTGHEYKPPSELRINYAHAGRAVLRGKPTEERAIYPVNAIW